MNSNTLSQVLSSNPTKNSIGAIRLICALFVVFGHAYTFGGFGIDPIQALTHNQITIGRIPVDIFFALSGYLISASFEKASSPREFLWHRFIRIYPAFWACIILTTFSIPLLQHVSLDITYLIHNTPLIVGIDQSINGVFEKNPVPIVINSSLWTLPWELRAYLLVLIIGMIPKRFAKPTVVILAIFFWLMFCNKIGHSKNQADLSAITSPFRLLMFFMTGACFYHFRQKIILNGAGASIAAAILIFSLWAGTCISLPAGGLFYAAAPIPLTYIIFFFAKSSTLSKINSCWDFSYGIYIYGALILQVLISHFPNIEFAPYAILSIAFTLIFGITSWYLIEKPSLAYRNIFKSTVK